MVRREVERLEVVPVVLDLRTVGQLVAEPGEDVDDPLERAADRVQPAAAAVAPRQADVDRFAGQARLQRGLVERGLARGQGLRDPVAGAVDRLARGLALVGGQRAQPAPVESAIRFHSLGGQPSSCN
jgi:hypothetical protein